MVLILIALGMAAMFLVQSYIAKLTWCSKIAVDIKFSEDTAFEGDTIFLTERVENGKHRPIVSLKVNLNIDRHLQFFDMENTAVSDRNYHSEVFAMAPQSVAERKIQCLCAKRGYYTISDAFIVSHDLFYTQRLISRIPQHDVLYVFPGRVDVKKFHMTTEHIIGELLSPNACNEDPFEFRGIREYEPFDPMRNINWKISAKNGDLKVNIYEHTSSQEVKIFVDAGWDTLLLQEDWLEEGIRIAAALAGRLIAGGITVAAESNGIDSVSKTPFAVQGGAGEQHNQAILRGLAGLEIGKSCPNLKMADLIKRERENNTHTDKKISYILISSETNKDMIEQWNYLCAESSVSWWIAPARRRSDVNPAARLVAEQIFWEVSDAK